MAIRTPRPGYGNVPAGPPPNANSVGLNWAGGGGFGPALPSYNQAKTAYAVNTGGWEAIRSTLYDSQQYLAAGATQLTFFQVPIGQGTSWVGTGTKNKSDTNMTLAGQLPANQNFLVHSIEVEMLTATPTVAADMPAAFGAQAVANSINDEYIFRRAGNLIFQIGSKDYLTEAPLMQFPASRHLGASAALTDVSTAGADLQSRIAVPFTVGQPYVIAPASCFLESSQNFSITLNWPEGVQAITNPARVFVRLVGVLYRQSQ